MKYLSDGAVILQTKSPNGANINRAGHQGFVKVWSAHRQDKTLDPTPGIDVLVIYHKCGVRLYCVYDHVKIITQNEVQCTSFFC